MTTDSGIFFLHPYSIIEDDELEAARTVFGSDRVSTNLADINEGDTVICRYRFLPFARELEAEIQRMGATPINSFHEHRNIADLFAWIGCLEGMTPPAYDVEDFYRLPEGEYFVKGETNSLKASWFTSAYAATKADVMNVVANVQRDMYIGGQRNVIRPVRH